MIDDKMMKRKVDHGEIRTGNLTAGEIPVTIMPKLPHYVHIAIVTYTVANQSALILF